MRSDYFKLLTEAMRKDEKIFFIMADTGYNLVEPLFEEFPDRTLNVGIAEQNLVGIAAGLSNMGFKPVCYAISQFLIQRAYEQIRNDLCHHNYPVILIGTSTGLDNGPLWATHYVLDDIGCLKALPNIHIYSPSSVESITHIFTETMNLHSPAYIRITKSVFLEGQTVDNPNRFILDTKNSKILIISHGRMTKTAFEISKTISNFSIFAIDKIKPLEDSLKNILQRYSKIVVIEDNFSSGLFNSLCQFVIEKEIHNTKLYSMCVPEDYGKNTGDTSFLDNKFELSVIKISAFLKQLENLT